MKTIISAVKTWTKGKIKDSTADWDQNNPEATNYVKNRTHYIERKILTSTGNDIYLDGMPVFKVGDAVSIMVDGVEYSLTAFDDEGPIIGDFWSDIENGAGKYGWQVWCDNNFGEVSFFSDTDRTVSWEGNIVNRLDTKYIPEEVLNAIHDAGSVANDAYSLASDKMSSNNPYGLGSLSMNRKVGSVSGQYSTTLGYGGVAIGDYSSANGLGVVATHANQNVVGSYNIIEPLYEEERLTTYIKYAQYYYKADSYTFNITTGIFSLVNPKRFMMASNEQGNSYYCKSTSGSSIYTNLSSSYNSSNYDKSATMIRAKPSEQRYIHIVGNGTSDTERSNAYTLDWDGNAWFAGKVYVGGTSMDDATELGTGGVTEEEKLEIAEQVAQLVDVPTDDHINDLVNSALGVIENASY